MEKNDIGLNMVLPIPIYGGLFVFTFNTTEKQFRKFIAKNNLTFTEQEYEKLGMSEISSGKCVMFECTTVVIRMKRMPVSCYDYGILQHEIFHGVSCYLDRLGLKLKINASDEAYSYLIGYITEKVYNEINLSL